MTRGYGGGRPRKMKNPQNITTRIDQPLLLAADLLKRRSSSITYSRLLSTGIRTELKNAGIGSDEIIKLLEEYWEIQIQDSEDQLAQLVEMKRGLILSPSVPPSTVNTSIEVSDDEGKGPSQPSAYLMEMRRDRAQRLSNKPTVREES